MSLDALCFHLERDTVATDDAKFVSQQSTLEAQLRMLLFNSFITNRNELLLWLISDFAQLEHSEHDKLRLLDIAQLNEQVAYQLLVQLCVKNPRGIGKLLRHRGTQLRDFFREHSDKIALWFYFKFDGKNENGGLALERYLFDNRDTAWEVCTAIVRGVR
jgi:hypothetical protein